MLKSSLMDTSRPDSDTLLVQLDKEMQTGGKGGSFEERDGLQQTL